MAVRSAARGLSTAELEQIRDVLAAGRRPKVVFTESAGQIAGQLGQVVELADPAVSDEWVVVRFGRDELPFSPADLAIAPKGAPPRRQSKAPSADTPAEPPGPPLLPPAPPAATRAATVSAPREENSVTVSDAQSPDVAASGNGASPARPADEAQPARPAKAPARKAVRVKPPATLTVTLTYADGEWMVAAQQGSKSLAKPYVIKAAEALKMVGMLDVPGVHEAVDEIVSAARAEAEAEAERLRSELAEIEARLAELRDVG